MSPRDRKRGERRPRRRPPKGYVPPLPPIKVDRSAKEPEEPARQEAAEPEPPAPRRPASRASGNDVWLVAVLVALAAGAFIPALSNDFVWDDYSLVVDNELVRSPANILAIFDRPFLPIRPNSYHPLATITYLLDFQVWRLNPIGYHTTNLTLHMIAALLVYAAAAQLLRRRDLAFAAGAIFAVHPVHVQPVAWIAGRAQPLATCLALFALLTYGSYVSSFGQNGRRPGLARVYYWASVVAFTLALFAHAAAAALLVLLPVYEMMLSRQRLEERRGAQALLPYVGFAAGAAMYFVVRWWALGYHVAPGFDVSRWPAHLYALPLWAMRGLEMLLLPVRSQPYYAPHRVQASLPRDVLAGAAALAIVIVLALRVRRVSPGAALAAWWALLTLAPALNPLPVPSSRFSERNLYLPSVGIAILAGWALVSLYDFALVRKQGWGRLLTLVAFVAAICAGMIVSWQRTSWYRDEVAFFSHMAQATPDLALAHFNLANAHLMREDAERAIPEYERAIALRPTVRAYHNLGNAYMAEGLYEEAAEAYRNALALGPDARAPALGLTRALDAQRARPSPTAAEP